MNPHMMVFYRLNCVSDLNWEDRIQPVAYFLTKAEAIKALYHMVERADRMQLHDVTYTIDKCELKSSADSLIEKFPTEGGDAPNNLGSYRLQ